MFTKQNVFTNAAAQILKYFTLVVSGVGLFLFLLYPIKPKFLPVEAVKASKNLGSKFIYKVEYTNTGVAYAWTRPNMRFIVTNLNRNTQLNVTLYLDLSRSQREAPATITVEMLRDSANGNLPTSGIVLATFQADPTKSGFQPYTFSVPPDTNGKKQLTFWLVSNPTRIAGSSGKVGVKLSGLKIVMPSDRFTNLIWPQPYLLAILLLIVALVLWSGFANFSWIEIFLLMLPFVLTVAAAETFLLRWSWLLLLAALILIGLIVTHQYYFKRLLESLEFDQPIESGDNPSSSILALTNKNIRILLVVSLLAGLVVGLFVIATPDFVFDTRLFLEWMAKIHQYGPFDIYKHIPNLDYPPFIVYVFWLYSWILAPFGLASNVMVFKLWLASCAVASNMLIWLLLRVKPLSYSALDLREKLAGLKRSQVLVVFSIALIFNPAVWGQVDALLILMLLIAFWAIYSPRPLLAGIILGLIFIFKPQAWLLLPLLAVLLLKKVGWKQGILVGLIGLSFSIGLSLLSFGNPQSVTNFLMQPSLAGNASGDAPFGSLYAFNVLWLFGFGSRPATDLVTWLGFGLIGLIEIIVLARTIWGRANQKEVALGAALVMLVFFLVAIKMRERYLYYPLPLLIWACMYNRKILKPYLILNVCCLINTLGGYLFNVATPLPQDFFYWPSLIQPNLLSWLTVLTTVYLLFLYLNRSELKNS